MKAKEVMNAKFLSKDEVIKRRRESQKKYYKNNEERTHTRNLKWQKIFIGECSFKKLCKIFNIRYESINNS